MFKLKPLHVSSYSICQIFNWTDSILWKIIHQPWHQPMVFGLVKVVFVRFHLKAVVEYYSSGNRVWKATTGGGNPRGKVYNPQASAKKKSTISMCNDRKFSRHMPMRVCTHMSWIFFCFYFQAGKRPTRRRAVYRRDIMLFKIKSFEREVSRGYWLVRTIAIVDFLNGPLRVWNVNVCSRFIQ